MSRDNDPTPPDSSRRRLLQGVAALPMLGVAGQSGVTTRVTVDGLDISDEHFGTVAQNISQDSI